MIHYTSATDTYKFIIEGGAHSPAPIETHPTICNPTFDSTTRILHIPTLFVDGGYSFAVDMKQWFGPVFVITDISPKGESTSTMEGHQELFQ
jgi:hypothetical protein